MSLWRGAPRSTRLAAGGFFHAGVLNLLLEATMGLLDNLNLGGALRGALGEVEAAALPAVLNAVLAKTQYNDLNGLVAALQKGGLNAQVQSWLGPGANHRSRQRPGTGICAPSWPAGRCNAQTLSAIPARHRRQGEPKRHAASEVTGSPRGRPFFI